MFSMNVHNTYTHTYTSTLLMFSCHCHFLLSRLQQSDWVTVLLFIPFLALVNYCIHCTWVVGSGLRACFIYIIRKGSLPNITVDSFQVHISQPILPNNITTFIVLLFCVSSLCSGSTGTTLSLVLLFLLMSTTAYTAFGVPFGWYS